MIAAILLALTALEATPVTPAGGAFLYLRCVVSEARNLEPSQEPATTIADVAVPKCENLLVAGAAQLTDEFLAKPDMQRYQANYQVNADDLQRENIGLLRRSGRDVAVRVVVEARAQRASKK